MILGIAIIVLDFIFCLIAFLNGNFYLPKENEVVRIFQLFPNSLLFKYNPWASLAGIALFGIGAPLLCAACSYGFKKTPSLEIVFFGLFIISCMLEQVRILIPLAWRNNTYAGIFYVEAKILMTARILGPLSLFFSFSFNKADQRQNMERNALILITVSILGGVLFPIDSNKITSTFTVLWSCRTVFGFFRLFLFLATLSLISVDILVKKNSDLKMVLIGFIILYAGYHSLQNTDCWSKFAVSAVLLSYGSYKYLSAVHELNVWQ